MPTPPSPHGFCITCGYPLINLTAASAGYRCPECGQPFDPADPKTFRKTAQHPLIHWLSKPIGWPTVILSLLAAAAVLAVSRWKLTTFAPSTVDLVYYFRPSALRHRTSLITPCDFIFTLAMLIAAAVFLYWLLRTLISIILRLRNPIEISQSPIHTGRRHALLAIASFLTATAAALGWPYRLAQQWAANRLAASNINGPPNVGPPTLLSATQTQATLRAAVIELPQVAQRMAGLQLLIEQNAPIALPILTEAVNLESDSATRALELCLIGLHRDPQTLDLLMTFLTHPNSETRAAAIDAIGLLHAPAYDIPLSPDAYQSSNPQPQPLATVGNPAIILDRLVALNRAPNWWDPQLRMDEAPLSPAIRDRVEQIMLTASSAIEREAAARALVTWPPLSYKLRIAEWGVWIDITGQLQLIQSVLDEIPSFVHRTGNPLNEFAGRVIVDPMIITKPIIHITVDRSMALDLTVMISRGRPWYAFPMPDDFTVHAGSRLVSHRGPPKPKPAPYLSLLDNPKLSPLPDIRQGYPWLTPDHDSSDAAEGGGWGPHWYIADLQSLGLRWQSIIATPTRLPWMTLPDAGPDPRFAWWTNLRTVPCAYVSSRGETEKFLYYDGPTLLPTPLTATLASQNLTFTLPKPSNDGFSEDPKTVATLPQSAILIRHINGKLSAQPIPIPSTLDPDHPQATITLQPDTLHDDQVPSQFHNMLTLAGLTPPEADGLITAWLPQFFQSPGTRLLQIMSRQTYDYFCPLQIRPKPTQLVRVGIILTEFPATASSPNHSSIPNSPS